jgi:hypothetical protein
MTLANFDGVGSCEMIGLVVDFLTESGHVWLASAQKEEQGWRMEEQTYSVQRPHTGRTASLVLSAYLGAAN